MLLDSKSAIDMAFDPVAFKKTKHVLRDAEYLRDLVAREVFKPEHVPSSRQLADAFTKALPRLVFAALVKVVRARWRRRRGAVAAHRMCM